MTRKIIALFLLCVALTTIPYHSVQAEEEEEEMKVWLTDSFNPEIISIVEEFNETAKENWFLNLSNHLLQDNKKSTVEKLELLRLEIESLKKDLRSIKPPKTAERKDKKVVKVTQKQLNRALNRMDKDARKLIKRINKDKAIENIGARSFEKKRIEEASNEYLALNKKYKIDASGFGLDDHIKIDETLAKHFINEEEKRLKKLEGKKKDEEEKKKEDDKEIAEERSKNVSEEAMNDLYTVILSAILGSEGRINNISPSFGDDWSSTVINVSNEWHLLSEKEQKLVAVTIGSEVRDTIVKSGLSSEPKIDFVDEEGIVVAYSKGHDSFLLNN